MKLAIIGSALAGGGVQIVDVLLENSASPKLDISDIRIYDDDGEAEDCNVLGVPVVGSLDRLQIDLSDGLIDSAVIGVGSIAPRQLLFRTYSATCLQFPNIISTKATVSRSARLGKGNVILPHVYIGPRVYIADNNYITTSTTINHDTSVGSHCYFSTAVSIAGRVQIEDCIRFDTSCSVTADATVKTNTLIGPGESFGPTRGL